MIGNLYCRFDTGSDRQGMNMNPNNNRRIKVNSTQIPVVKGVIAVLC